MQTAGCCALHRVVHDWFGHEPSTAAGAAYSNAAAGYVTAFSTTWLTCSLHILYLPTLTLTQ